MRCSQWFSASICLLVCLRNVPAFPVAHNGEHHDATDSIDPLEELYGSESADDSASNDADLVLSSSVVADIVPSATVVLDSSASASASAAVHEDQHQDHQHESHDGPMASMASMTPSPASMSAHGHHHHSGNILSDPNLEPQQRAYWEAYNSTNFFSANATIPNRAMLYSHMALTTIAWVGIFPFTLMMGVEHHRYFLAAQTLQTGVALAALFCLLVFGATCPGDLYPNNAYSKMSVILFFWVVTHYLSVVIKELAKSALRRTGPIDGAEYVLANMSSSRTAAARSAHQGQRPSYDSSHAYPTSDNNNSDNNDSNNDDVHQSPYDDYNDDFSVSAHDSAESEDADGDDDHQLLQSGQPQPYMNNGNAVHGYGSSRIERFQNGLLQTVMKSKYAVTVVTKFKFVADLVFVLLHRPLFLYAYTYYVTGITTGFRMAMGHSVFNLLAHLIKGSIFTVYGFLTLARFCGAFKKKGFAWNIKPGSKYDTGFAEQLSNNNNIPKAKRYPHDDEESADDVLNDDFMDPHRSYYTQRRSDDDSVRLFSRIGDLIPSLEFVESFLIFFYGSTNVFMEHLGHDSAAWSHKDLQHVSIAFMYFGGGLCGLLLESKFAKRAAGVDLNEYNLRNGFSFNPIPAFIVFWTGILMSQHEQELPLSTTIHAQWGYMFVVGAIFRAFTYLMLFVSPPTSTSPSRPFTEIITSFCLICGGMVFMQSNDQTVQGMMYRGLDGMFTLNVNVGVSAIIMSYVMVVMTFKGWISKDN